MGAPLRASSAAKRFETAFAEGVGQIADGIPQPGPDEPLLRAKPVALADVLD